MLRWLLLLWWRGRGSEAALSSIARHDGAEVATAHADGGRLWRTGVLVRATNGTRRTCASILKLAAKKSILLLVPAGRWKRLRH